MRVLIAGVDGYLGWSLAMYLTARGHEVAGADCYHRRDWVAEMGSQSATPIKRMTDRIVKLPNGKEYEVCGMPLGHTDEQMREAFPDLMQAFDGGNANEQAFQILKLNHPELERKGFWVDEYASDQIQKVFFGSIYDQVKKKT